MATSGFKQQRIVHFLFLLCNILRWQNTNAQIEQRIAYFYRQINFEWIT